MKMKTAGDIFTATSMGWGWVNIALALQISLVEGGGGGLGEEKKSMCMDWYAESRRIFQISLQAQT